MSAKIAIWIGLAGAVVTGALSLIPILGRGETPIYLGFFLTPLTAVFILIAMAGFHRMRTAAKSKDRS